MGRLVTVILLVQISLPGFCCIANRGARSVALLMGFANPVGELYFLKSSCCGRKCCATTPLPVADCCNGTVDCAGNEAPQNMQSSQSDDSGRTSSEQPSGPCSEKLCECLESDPMLPPSAILIDLVTDEYVIEILDIPFAISSSYPVSTARYHPPPLRRHLFLCVIRC